MASQLLDIIPMEAVMRFQGIFPCVGYNHVLMMVLAVAITLFSLLLSACTSTTTKLLGLYLTYLSYQPVSHSTSPAQVNPELTTTFAGLVNGSSLEVRAGYFGLCARYAAGIWTCSRDSAGLASLFQPYQDPLNLIWVQARFKEGIVFSGLLIAAVALAFVSMCLLATFPGWHYEEDGDGNDREIKPFPGKKVSFTAMTSSVFASLLALAAMTWQHTASVAAATMAQNLGYGTVKSEVGAASLALGWVGSALMVISALGLVIMVLSTWVLEQLVEEHE